MNLLCNSELFYSISEETVEELKLLIKQAIDVIQSLVIHVPPLVVDCSPHPDINSGAYPGKKVAGLEAEKYVTTQSALFYSYKGQLVARTGELSPIASISKAVLAQFWSDFLKSQFQIDEKSSSERDHTKATNNSQEVIHLLNKDVKYRKDYKTCSDEQIVPHQIIPIPQQHPPHQIIPIPQQHPPHHIIPIPQQHTRTKSRNFPRDHMMFFFLFCLLLFSLLILIISNLIIL